MALVLISGLRGGVGTTMLAANLAITVGAMGRSSVALALAPHSTLGLHFGLDPHQALPGFAASSSDSGAIHGVRLLDASGQAASGDLGDGLSSGDYSFAGDAIHIADLSGTDARVAAQLRAHADVELCVLVPTAECVYALPAALETLPDNALFLLNRNDDTRRLARHTASFVRELLDDRLIATIQADEAVAEAAAMMQPLMRHAPASAALADIAALGERLATLPRSREDSVQTFDRAWRSNAA